MTYYCKACAKAIAASGRTDHLGPLPHDASSIAIAANYARAVWKSDPDAIKACARGLSDVDKYALFHMYGTIAGVPIGEALVDWCRREVASRSGEGS